MAIRVPFRVVVRDAIGGGWGQEAPFADSIPVAVIRGTDFDRARSADYSAIPRRHEERRKASRRLLHARDVILEVSGGSPTSGQTTGRSLFVTEQIVDGLGSPVIPASFCRLIRFREDLVDPRYAFYALQDMYLSGRAGDYEHQSTGISNFQFEFFLDQEAIRLPPLDEQGAIAHILGSLDDKIELNRRTNETLEAIARALFKSWFVDFDPVRAKSEGRDPGLPPHLADLFLNSFEDSELGEIPRGWGVAGLGALIELAYGRALKEEDRRPGSVAVFGANGQIGRHNEALVRGPGIVVGRKGNPGVVTWAPTDFFPIDTAFYVIPKDPCRSLHFLFYALRDHDLASFAADSAVPGLNRNLAYLSRQVVPPSALLEAFDRRVRPLFDRVYEADREAGALAAIRDALLPKLISGELRVNDAERVIGRAL